MLPFTVAFRMDLPHGHCVGIHLPLREPTLPASARAQLHADELAVGDAFGPRRRITWWGGRLALRTALQDLGVAHGAIAPNDRGAPVLPEGLVGSVSHKDDIAVALLAARSGWEVGVDVESPSASTRDVARHVLTGDEQSRLASLTPDARAREVLLRFSAKEALYKALDPHVRRFVAFKEVEAEPRGAEEIAFHLALGAGEGPFEAEGRWLARDDLILTTARVRPAG